MDAVGPEMLETHPSTAGRCSSEATIRRSDLDCGNQNVVRRVRSPWLASIIGWAVGLIGAARHRQQRQRLLPNTLECLGGLLQPVVPIRSDG